MKRVTLYFCALLMLVGISLLGVATYGYFTLPARDQGAYHNDPHKIIVALRRIKKPTGHYYAFSRRVTDLIYHGIRHDWYPQNQSKKLGLPFIQNWGLYLYYRVLGRSPNVRYSALRFFEYSTYPEAISRGVGLCSQHALAVTDYIKTQFGFETKSVGLHGHVVNETTFPNKQTFVLDSDFNVVLPFSVAYAHQHLDLTKQFYKRAGVKPKLVDVLGQIYANPNPNLYFPHEKIKWVFAQWVGFVFPLMLILFSCLLFWRARRK